MIRLAIVSASTSPNRTGSPIAAWVAERARHCRAFDVDEIDLQQVALPLFDEPFLPRYRRYTHPHTLRWSERVESQDAFVFVMPEYNRGYPALLKNALDFLVQEWAFKPAGIVSYGSGMTAGIRGAEALRGVLSALQMHPVRETVMVPCVDAHLHGGVFAPTPGMVEGAELMLESIVRADAAMNLLRTTTEEVGGQQGDDPELADRGDGGYAPRPARDEREAWRRSAMGPGGARG